MSTTEEPKAALDAIVRQGCILMALTAEQSLEWIIGFKAFRDGSSYAEAAGTDLVKRAAKVLGTGGYLSEFDPDKIGDYALRFGQGMKDKNRYAVVSLWHPGRDYPADDWCKAMLADGGRELHIYESDRQEHAQMVKRFEGLAEPLFVWDLSREKTGYPYDQMGYVMYLVTANTAAEAIGKVATGAAKHILGVTGEAANNISGFRDDVAIFAEIIGDPSRIVVRGQGFFVR